MKISIVYDNEAEEGLIKDWGFSCLIGDRILFDTGASQHKLLQNMEKMKVDLDAIDTIILSHEHSDHTGGIKIAEYTQGVKVFIPHSFSRRKKASLEQIRGVELIEVTDTVELLPGIMSTGELGSIAEQSLMVDTVDGIVVVTGCSHPGLDVILGHASKWGELYGVIGGFHGFEKFEVLADLKLIVPCHCTKWKKSILSRYPERSQPCAAGCVFEI